MIDLAEIQKFNGQPIKPYPGATTRWDFFRTLRANKELDQAKNNPQESALALSRFIFDMHPDVLDLAPGRAYRYRESARIMDEFPNGKDVLQGEVLAHFEQAKQRFESGYTLVKAGTIISPNNQDYPSSKDFGDGSLGQKVKLPPEIQRRAILWNDWVQNLIKNGQMEDLFTTHPLWLGTKLAEGTHLQMGNLVVEVGDGLGRIRADAHREKGVEKKWRLGPTEEDSGIPGAGMDQWFVMSHIAEKDLLRLSEGLGEGMIDGMQLTPEVYAKSYVPILKLIELNPQLQIKGILSDGSWIYSGELTKVFPDQHISGLHDIAGDVVDIGTAEELGVPIQAYFATLNPERARAYDEGRYKATVAARFIDPAGMRLVIEKFGLAT